MIVASLMSPFGSQVTSSLTEFLPSCSLAVAWPGRRKAVVVRKSPNTVQYGQMTPQQMGAGRLSFCLALVKFNQHRKDGKWCRDKESIDSATKTKAKDVFHLSGGDLNKAFRSFFRWSHIRKKSKLQNEKTMVGFGRTEKSLSLSCTEFRALSHGHGFRGPCFNGVRKSWVFHDFWIVF